jgi:hypothetical protein
MRSAVLGLGSKGRGQLQHSELKERVPIVSPSENRDTRDIKIAKKAKMITVKWGNRRGDKGRK